MARKPGVSAPGASLSSWIQQKYSLVEPSRVYVRSLPLPAMVSSVAASWREPLGHQPLLRTFFAMAKTDGRGASESVKFGDPSCHELAAQHVSTSLSPAGYV